MKRILNVLLFLSLTLAAASAQNNSSTPPPPPPHGGMDHFHMGMGPGPMGDWWKNSDIAQQLNLTDQQKEQLQHIFSSHRASFMDLRNNLRTEDSKLKDLVNQDQPQDDQVLAQVDQVAAARAKLDREFATVTLAFRKVLTPEQWKQLQSLTAQRMMRFREFHGGEKPGAPSNPPK